MGGEFAEKIRRIPAEVRENEPMASHTSFGIGGPADIWAEPRTREALFALLDLCQEEDVPYMIIGRGTNLLAVKSFMDSFARLAESRPTIFSLTGPTNQEVKNPFISGVVVQIRTGKRISHLLSVTKCLLLLDLTPKTRRHRILTRRA